MPDRLSEPFVVQSDAMRNALEDVAYAARTDAKILITGESGVGKEVLARLIHTKSHRGQQRFVTINCAGVPDSLLETELFGHVRGSFTGAYRDRTGLLEQANGGTIFMDEVGEMSLRMQALLLRFLETGEIQPVGGDYREARLNVRVIAATHRNLLHQIAERTFREDLYYRLNVIHINIPPLRERRDEIPVLLEHFFRQCVARYDAPPPDVTPEALERLVAYNWPGNVRELRNVAERLTLRGRNRPVGIDALPAEIVRNAHAPQPEVGLQRKAAEDLYERMVAHRESFWVVVYGPFMSRDLTRDDLRLIVARGLETTHGSYTALVRLFNLQPREYKRFLNFLHKHGCHLPYRRFRQMDLSDSISTPGEVERRAGVSPGERAAARRR